MAMSYDKEKTSNISWSPTLVFYVILELQNHNHFNSNQQYPPVISPRRKGKEPQNNARQDWRRWGQNSGGEDHQPTRKLILKYHSLLLKIWIKILCLVFRNWPMPLWYMVDINRAVAIHECCPKKYPQVVTLSHPNSSYLCFCAFTMRNAHPIIPVHIQFILPLSSLSRLLHPISNISFSKFVVLT